MAVDLCNLQRKAQELRIEFDKVVGKTQHVKLILYLCTSNENLGIKLYKNNIYNNVK